VGRSHDTEVPVVERRDLVLAESLGQGDKARVHNPQPEVTIGFLERSAAKEIGNAWVLKSVGAGQQVVEECRPHVIAQPLAAPVVELGEHQAGDHQILLGIGEEAGTARVIPIRLVKGRQQRPGIQDERH